MEVRRYSGTSPLQTTPPLASTKALDAPGQEKLAKAPSQALDNSQASGINVKTINWEDDLTPEVMKELDKLAGMELAPGIDRDELIKAILDNLRDPTSINQGDRQTCSATVVQMTLAREDPAEYVRFMAGLASPKGEAKLRDGSILKRDPNYQLGGGKSISDKLFQPALMQKATKGGYDSLNDRRLDGKGQGLYAAEQAKLLESLTGRKTETVFGNDEELLGAVKTALKDGNRSSATIKLTDPKTGEAKGHSVIIEKMEHGLITYLDPNKGRVTMPLEKFKGNLESVNLPSQYLTPALKSRPKQDGSVAGWAISLPAIPNPIDLAKQAIGATGQAIQSGAKAVVAEVKEVVVNEVQKRLGFGKTILDSVDKTVREAREKVEKTVEEAKSFIGSVDQACNDFITDTKQAIQDGVNDLKEGLRDPLKMLGEIGEGAKQFWDQYGGIVVTGLSIACMVIPGMQVVSLGLAIYQAVQGGAEMIEGIRTNDWKRALGGAASMLGAVAGGAAVGGIKVFGSAAKTVADVAKNGSRICSGIVTTMDAIEAKDPGKLLGVLVKGAGGAAIKLSNGLDKLAEQGMQIYEKCEKYGTKLQKAYDAFSSGNILEGLALTTSTVANANSEFGGDAALSENLEKVSKATRTLGVIKNAAEKRDFGRVVNGLGQLGTDLKLQIPEMQIDPKVMEGINQGVKLGNKLVALNDAVNSGDPQRIKSAGLELAESTQLMDSNTRQRLDKMADKGIKLGQLIQSGDYGGAALVGLDLSKDAGVVSEKDARGILDTTRKVTNLVQAAQARDPQALVAATKELGLLDEGTAKSLDKVVTRANAIKEAYDRKDFGTLASVAGDVAVESGILTDGDRRNLQNTLQKGDTLIKNIQEGNYEDAAKQLGVPKDIIQKYSDGKALYDKATQGNIADFAKQLGIPQEHIEMAQKALNLSDAVRNGDFETVAKEAGLMGLQAQVLNHPAVKSAQEQVRSLEELKSAIEKGDLSTAQPLLEKLGPLPELPEARTLSRMYAQLNQGIKEESLETVSEMGKKVAEMSGVLDHPAVKEVKEYAGMLEEAKGKLEGMDSQAIMRYLSNLFRDGRSQVTAK